MKERRYVNDAVKVVVLEGKADEEHVACDEERLHDSAQSRSPRLVPHVVLLKQ